MAMKDLVYLYVIMVFTYLMVIASGMLVASEDNYELQIKPREIPSVIYDEQKKQCVLTYKDTMIVRECR